MDLERVALAWCVRFAGQIIARSWKGRRWTHGITNCCHGWFIVWPHNQLWEAKSVQRLDRFLDAWSSTPLHCTGMLQIIMLGLTFTTQNGVAPWVCSPSSPSVKNPEPMLATSKLFLFFTLSFVSVRPPCATNTSTAPIAMWMEITCFACGHLLTRWLHWLDFRFDCTSLLCVVVTRIVHHGLVSVSLSQRLQRSFVWSARSVTCHPTRCVFCGPVNICWIA